MQDQNNKAKHLMLMSREPLEAVLVMTVNAKGEVSIEAECRNYGHLYMHLFSTALTAHLIQLGQQKPQN